MEALIIAALGAALAGGGWAILKAKWKKRGKKEVENRILEAKEDLYLSEILDRRKAEEYKDEIEYVSWDELVKELEERRK